MTKQCWNSYKQLNAITGMDKTNDLIQKGTEQVNDVMKIIGTTTSSTGRAISQSRLSELQHLFDEAKQNCNSAPREIKTTEKNLLVYEYGESKYDDIMLDRYKTQASNLKRKMTDKANGEMANIKKTKQIYLQKIEYLNNMTILLNKLNKENAAMKSKFQDQINTIEINDRKTYYEENQNDYTEWFSKHFEKKYWIMVILFIIAFVYKQLYKESKYWIITVVLIFFPYIIKKVITLFYAIYLAIYSQFKNVYLYEDD